MRAWLLTWVTAGRAGIVAGDVALILHESYSRAHVRDCMPLVYALRAPSLSKMLAWAGKQPPDPYVYSDGVWMKCGTNPTLQARLVSDLIVDKNTPSGLEKVRWTEPDGTEQGF